VLGFVLRRVLQALLTLLVATLLVRLVVFLLPGDPIAARFFQQAPDPEYQAYLEDLYDLDEAFLVQWVRSVGGLLRGDLGPLYAGGQVRDVVLPAIPVSLRLLGAVAVLQVLVGVPLGVLAFSARRLRIDDTLLIGTSFVLAVPVFLSAQLVGELLASDLGEPLAALVDEGWAVYVPPALVLSVVPVLLTARLVRNALHDEVAQPWIRVARAAGIPARRLIGLYALRPALVTVVTAAGAEASALLSASVLVEGPFGVPGLGSALQTGVQGREAPLVTATLLVCIVIATGITLVVDLVAAVLDPRLHAARR